MLMILIIVTGGIIISKYNGVNDKSIVVKNTEYEINPSPVYGDIKEGAVLYDGCEGGSVIYRPNEGEEAEILKDRGTQWYYVKVGGRKGWIQGDYLCIPVDPETNDTELSEEKIEEYINSGEYISASDMYVWVDIDRQRIYVLKGKNSDWKLEKVIVCATGKNESPTTRGYYQIQDRGKWFYSERLGSGAMYWVRFNGSYLFHSVAMDKNKEVTDGVLGERRSSGCVRMSVEDAEWFYENIEYGTGVWIN